MTDVSERAKQVYADAIVIDSLEALFPPRDVGYFQRAVATGITAIHCTIPHISDDLLGAITKTAEFMKLVESVGAAEFVRSADDIERAKKQGKLGIIAGMQDTIPFERNLDLIRVFHQLGFRIIQLAYFKQNYIGCGCVEKVDSGITDIGKDAIKELNRLGILIDTSHCGDRTAREAAELSADPIAITHTTPAALVDIPRARGAETIKAVAARGGVIGQVLWTAFCERRDKMGERATIKDYVDLLDYQANLVGIDHVGIGSDLVPFWGPDDYHAFMKTHGVALTYPHKVQPWENVYVEGFKGIEDTIRIAEELLRRGYSDEDIKKVLGGNWLRLFRQVWK